MIELYVAEKTPHEIREFVNELTKIGKDFGHTQQLRDRVSRKVLEFFEESTYNETDVKLLCAEELAKSVDAYINDKSVGVDRMQSALNAYWY